MEQSDVFRVSVGDWLVYHRRTVEELRKIPGGSHSFKQIQNQLRLPMERQPFRVVEVLPSHIKLRYSSKDEGGKERLHEELLLKELLGLFELLEVGNSPRSSGKTPPS